MAKKVVMPEEEVSEDNKPKKKKRGPCCTCCIVLLVFCLVVIAAAFGIGWYIGDSFTKEYLDMSLGEVFGVMGDMYWANDKKVVTNPYTDADIDGFYKEIKRNILLKEDADVDFDGALNAAVKSYLEGNGNNSGSLWVARALNDGENLDGSEESGETSFMDIFTEMLVGVLNRDNIDTDRLDAYDENDPSTDTYVFDLNDKQLAAFIGSVLKSVLNNADKVDELKDFYEMVRLADVVSLKQICFTGTKDGDETKSAFATVTVWLGLQDAAGQALTSVLDENGMSWLAPLARGMGNMLLPKNLYINVGIPLYGDGEPVISFNTMTEKDRLQAYKFVNGIMRATADGETVTIEEALDGFAEGLKPALETAASYMDFGNVTSGNIRMDLLGSITKMASEGFEGDPLTKADFIYLLKALFSDPEIQLDNLEPYRYTNRYLVDGKEVYIKGGDPTKTPIDYEEEFIKEIERKYALKFEDGTKLDDVLAMLGVSMGDSETESSDILQLIDSDEFNALVNVNDIKSIELNVTDRMLAAALSGQLHGSLTGGDSDFAGMDITLDALTFIKKQSKPNNLYALLAVEADLTGMFDSFGDSDIITQLATGLMPSKMVFTLTVDITRSRPAGSTPDPVEFVLNSCENTDRALSVLEKLSPSLNIKAMSENIEDILNDMLDQMYKSLEIRLVPSTAEKVNGVWTGENGALVMPDIFTVVTDMVLIDDDGNKVVMPEELKDVLKALNDTSDFNNLVPIADGYGGFIDDVVDKYYLAPSEDDDLSDFATLTSFMSDFDTDKFRVTGQDVDTKYLAYDTRSVSELKPVMSGAELGALIVEQMQGSDSDINNYAVESVTTATDMLNVVLSIDVDTLLPEDVKFMLTQDELFVTASVDTATVVDGNRYDVSVRLNGMDETTYDNTLKIVRFFNADFDIEEQVKEFGEIMYEQMQKINNSFAVNDSGEDGGVEQVEVVNNGNTDFFAFTDNGLEMNDFYTFLANKMDIELDEKTTPDTLKRVVQGMYVRSNVAALYNRNNYEPDDIIVNRGDKDWGDDKRLSAHMSDTEFNAYIAGTAGNIGSADFEQTIVLSAGDTATEAQAVREWASDRLDGELSVNSDYMLVTVAIEMGDFMVSGKNAEGFLPESVVSTIVYRFENGEFINVGIIFNELNADEYDILQKLMGLSADSTDESKVNINTVEKETADVLNGISGEYAEVTLGGRYNNSGIGSIIISA